MNIIGWVLMVLGGLFLGIGVWLLSSAYASTSWPTVEGKVVERNVMANVRSAGSALHRYVEYTVGIDYQYEVESKTYQSSRFSLGTGDTIAGGFNERSEGRAWLKNSIYQADQPVTVYVDPNDPTNTVLSSGINWATFVPMYVSVLFFLLGYFLRFKLVEMQNRANKNLP